MISDIIKQIWPEWEIEAKPLGKGSYGSVYKAVRNDYNVKSYAAIKTISIPSDPAEIDSLRSEGLDLDATKTLLRGIVDDFINEIQLMESFKGVQNIVSIEDYKVIEKTNEIGWDILIRMELLTTLNKYICDKKLSEKEIIKLGSDICEALEICSKRNIIHRDIKPENIFINDFGYFKLGDFGIARKMENLTVGLSQKGTLNYMAPEVAMGKNYDSRADIYSLGIVLYRLLNLNRLPFLDAEKQILNPDERKNAIDRRLRGESLFAPCEASPEMAEVILRACAFDPNERFSSAEEMKNALLSVANGTYKLTGIAIRQPDIPAVQPETPSEEIISPRSSSKRKYFTAFSASAAVLLLGAGITAFALNNPSYMSDKGGYVVGGIQSSSNDDGAIIGPTYSSRPVESSQSAPALAASSSYSSVGESSFSSSSGSSSFASASSSSSFSSSSSSSFSSSPSNSSSSFSSSSGSSSSHSSSSSKSSSSSASSSSSSRSSSSRSSSSSSSTPTPPASGNVSIQGMNYDIAQTTYLQLNNSNITDADLKEISKLVNVTHLELEDGQITDLSPLKNMPNLKEIVLRGNNITNISPLENMTQLTYLDLSLNQVSDITPLKNLKNLTTLSLYLNKVSNISALKDLTNLKELRLNENGEIKDISALGNLKNLEFLNLDDNQVSNLDPLKNLTDLETLYLNSNKVSDISSLKNIHSLKNLWLGDNQITNISSIESLTGLTYINLSGNKVDSIEPLSKLSNLTGVHLGGMDLIDISALKGLTNLKGLWLENNYIADISPIEDLTQLEELWLYNNSFKTIEALSKLTNLKILYLNSNQISDISPLASLINLERLDFNCNMYSDITPLKYLTKLEMLDMCYNNITDLSPLKDLKALKWLNLHSNQITDVSALSGLTNLTYLMLYDNGLFDAKPLSNLKNLRDLFLYSSASEEDKAYLRKELIYCNIS